MEKEKIKQIISKCVEVFKNCEITIEWFKNYLKEHPHIIEIPEELNERITKTQLELYDTLILLENVENSLGKEEENE